ncbi:MAG: Nif3-like dinuclear metal center hexameric protein [Treponema sp.]|nr:Nif3-like dinuclear metal center hexameric protein [Treponema sp.]
MTLIELDNYFNSFLRKENFAADPSRNGIQIQNSAPTEKPIEKVAFAVDACEATALAAAACGAQALFVHHGLFWGGCTVLTDSHYKRVAAFIKNDIALIAYHIPLDAHEKVGNNYGLASRIGLKRCVPFGEWHGMTLGVKGELRSLLSIDELARCALRSEKTPCAILPFGKKDIRTVGIISGGASEDVVQAAAENLDAYITGAFEHEYYHIAKEAGINVIAGGHYETETVGVNLVRAKLEKEKRIQTTFIDIPTGL